METVQKKSHKHAILALLSLCLMYAVYTGVVFNSTTLFMDPMLKEFPDWARAEWMLLITIMGIINAIGSLVFFTPIVNKFGMKNSRWIAGASLTLGCALLASTMNFLMFLAAGVLLGFGITFGANATLSMGINDWFKKHMSTMIAIGTTCGGVVGIVMAPIVGGWITAAGNPILQMFYDIGGSYSLGFITYIIATVICAVMLFVATRKRAMANNIRINN